MKRSLWARRVLFFLIIAPLAILVFGGIVMLLWNNVLAPVLHISTVTFWQGLGILLLSKILFSSFGRGGGCRRGYWKHKMMWDNMTAEQKEKFKEEWKNRGRRWGYRSSDSETGDEQVNAG